MKIIFLPVFLAFAFASIHIHFEQFNSNEKKILRHQFDKLFYSKRMLSLANITNLGDNQYFIEAAIGTPWQVFTLLISSVSSWIWVDNINCSKCRQSINKFNSNLSSTFKTLGSSKDLESVGEISGKVCTEKIGIGSSQIEVLEQSFVLADEEENSDSLMADGVFGLGFDEDNSKSFISNLKDAGKIANRQFAVYLNYYETSSDMINYGKSSIVIDGYDSCLSSVVSQGFSYINVDTSEKKWEVKCNYVSFGNKILTQSSKATISLGASWILGPINDISTIMSSFFLDYHCGSDNSGFFKCNCDKEYPEIIFQLDGSNFTVKQSEYFQTFNNSCYPSFGYSPKGDTWILGDTFLRIFYTNFDIDNKKIGLAKLEINQASPNSPTTPPNPSTPTTPQPNSTDNQILSNPLLNHTNSSSINLSIIITIPLIFAFIAIPSAIYIYCKTKKIEAKKQLAMEIQKQIEPNNPGFLPVFLEEFNENANLEKKIGSDTLTREPTSQLNEDNEKKADFYPSKKDI